MVTNYIVNFQMEPSGEVRFDLMAQIVAQQNGTKGISDPNF